MGNVLRGIRCAVAAAVRILIGVLSSRHRAIQNRRPPDVTHGTIGVPSNDTSSTPIIASGTTCDYEREPSPLSNNQITARSNASNYTRTEIYNTNHRPPTLYNPASLNSRLRIAYNYNSSNNRQSTRTENHNSNQRPQSSRPQNSNDYNLSQNAAFSGTNRHFTTTQNHNSTQRPQSLSSQGPRPHNVSQNVAFSGTNRQFTNSRNRNFNQNRQRSSRNTPIVHNSRNSNTQNEPPARNNVNSRRGRRNNWNRRGRNNQNRSNQTNQQKEPCVVCLDKEKKILLMPCAHLCLCRSCAQQVMNLNRSCPICRSRIERTIEAYF